MGDSPTCIKMAATLWAVFVCCYCLNAVLVGVQGKADYYEVLGVRRSASYKDIRTSYKKLAREWWVVCVNVVISSI